MKKHSSVLLLLVLGASLVSRADIRLPRILSSGMVLQANSMVTLWGWGTPGEHVTVSAGWMTGSVSTVTDVAGKWSIRIGTGDAGGPYRISFQGRNQVVLGDVLLGEVWLCSGQSNMEYTIRMLGGWKQYPGAKKTLKRPGYGQVRLCQVAHAASAVPLDLCHATWVRADAETVADFSATAWFFGKLLADSLGVPIGLISANIGGTPAEAWTPLEPLTADPELRYYLASPNGQQSAVNRVSVLYNAMIHPLVNYTIRGAIWYQGEANILDADLYGRLFSTMIRSWRKAWDTGDFPFYFVQIAPFDYREPFLAAAYLREAQQQALSLPNTGMAVTMDIGNVHDIHPKNKPAAGQRLALLALSKTYGQTRIVTSGPVFRRLERDGNRLRVLFDFADTLIARGAGPAGFYIAGRDRKFRPVKALCDGRSVTLPWDGPDEPTLVRYAFTDTACVDLFNGAGLPAVPFRTDTIPLLVRNVNIRIHRDPIYASRSFSIDCPDPACVIRYTADGSEPNAGSALYAGRIRLDTTTMIRARAFRGSRSSAQSGRAVFLKHAGLDRRIRVSYPFSGKYPGGENALLDGIRGSVHYNDGNWQGYHGADLDGVIDLGATRSLDSVSVSLLQAAGSWIFLPSRVEIAVSADSTLFTRVAEFRTGAPGADREPFIKTYTWINGVAGQGEYRGKIRYIRVFAKNIGTCPKGHPGRGGKAWLFADEIAVW